MRIVTFNNPVSIRWLIDEMEKIVLYRDDIRTIRVAIDTDGFKIKINEYVWSPGMGIPPDEPLPEVYCPFNDMKQCLAGCPSLRERQCIIGD